MYDIHKAEKKDTEAPYDTSKEVLKDYFEQKKYPNGGKQIQAIQTTHRRIARWIHTGKLAKTREFTNADKEVMPIVIKYCRSNRLRRRALREPDKSLDVILTLGRTLELANVLPSDSECETVNKIHREKTQNKTKEVQYSPHEGNSKTPKTQSKNTHCLQCGGIFPHRQEPCPAKVKTYKWCHKPNHYASVCQN